MHFSTPNATCKGCKSSARSKRRSSRGTAAMIVSFRTEVPPICRATPLHSCPRAISGTRARSLSLRYRVGNHARRRHHLCAVPCGTGLREFSPAGQTPPTPPRMPCDRIHQGAGGDLEKMKRLARRADVFTTTYRVSVNHRFGLSPVELAAASERRITYVNLPSASESSFAIVSGESCSTAAWRFSRRCLTEDVPGISRILGAR